MIIKFKLFEDIGISWISPEIKKILSDYDMDINFSNTNNSQLICSKLFYQGRTFPTASYRYGIDIDSMDLEDFFKALDRAEKIFEISKEKIEEIKDRVCEYYVKINMSNFSLLMNFMSDELLTKLENDKVCGKVATEELVSRSANKYNL